MTHQNRNEILSAACTSFLVGKEMTHDGSFISARSEDWDEQYSKHFEFYTDTDNGPTEFAAKDSPFKCSLPSKALGYSALAPYHLPSHWGSAGFNTAGVGMSATETIFSNAKALQADPLVESGVAENCIFNITLPYIHTAKEGVLRVGEMIETYGSAEGFGISFVDDKELWYLESAAGHRWIATRIPNDMYFVSGNQSRFRTYDPKDTDNYLASKDLIEFAIANGMYNPAEGDFDFHTAYAKDDEADTTYNYPRVWYLQSIFSPEIKNDVTKNTFPVFAKAKNKISVDDVKAAFRTHYNNTEHDPYLHSNPKEPYRPISIFRTTQTHILHLRPELPQAIGRTNYVALGMAALSMFLPYYQGLDTLPNSYHKGDNTFSNDSVYWQYRKVQTLAMMDFNTLAPIVQKIYSDFETAIAQKQKEVELQYLECYQSQPLKAKSLLQEFTNNMIEEAALLNDSLTNQLFTLLAASTQKTYLFHGA